MAQRKGAVDEIFWQMAEGYRFFSNSIKQAIRRGRGARCGECSVAVLGTAGLGRRSSTGPLFENFLLTKIILQVFSLKFLCHKGVFKCFPVISFQFFLRCGAPSGLPKVRGCGPLGSP